MITQMSEENIPRFKIVISGDRIKVDIVSPYLYFSFFPKNKNK